MPKEAVFGEVRQFTSEQPPQTPVVEVCWQRESGSVQIVSRVQECEVSSEEPIPCWYGYYVDLDRSGINALIRKLRKARDQAFGVDE